MLTRDRRQSRTRRGGCGWLPTIRTTSPSARSAASGARDCGEQRDEEGSGRCPVQQQRRQESTPGSAVSGRFALLSLGGLGARLWASKRPPPPPPPSPFPPTPCPSQSRSPPPPPPPAFVVAAAPNCRRDGPAEGSGSHCPPPLPPPIIPGPGAGTRPRTCPNKIFDIWPGS